MNKIKRRTVCSLQIEISKDAVERMNWEDISLRMSQGDMERSEVSSWGLQAVKAYKIHARWGILFIIS